ncbi:NDR1/HIN1-like protein 2 [Neltuma alba]|uniref:NDR1/HIN1-like protein 2 n=1 Tax=Neltuma alba TaxID=207710 RepID=UPI0010A49274|nr:NDR1/HIN1-like protein 2 [Prosopis alba]
MVGDRGSRSRRSRCSTCVPNITLYLVLLFVLLTCVIGMAWFVMNPHEPSIRVTSLSVSHFSVSDTELTGTYDIEFNVSNPNKKIDIFLDEFSVSIRYHKAELARGTEQKPEPISLERSRGMNVKVRVVMKADSPKLRKNKVFAQVLEDWRRMKVKFDVRMELSVRFEAGNWPPKSKLLNLNCGGVSVDFFRDGKDAGKFVGTGGKDDCHV